MTTFARRFASVPVRTSSETWRAIANHIATPAQRDDFLEATNAAAILIADEVPATTPIVLTGAGPRIHVYTVHGDDATNGHNVNEATISNLSFSDDWMLYLPDHPTEPGLVDELVSNPHIRIGEPPNSTAADQSVKPGGSRVDVIDLRALESR